MMIKLIVFDWDDVITKGSKEGYISCLHNTLVDLGINLDPQVEKQRILSTWGKPHQEELKNLLRERPDLLDSSIELYEKKFFGDTFVNSLELVSGVNELLVRLSKRYALAVATGAHPLVLKERVIPKFKIPSVFSAILSGYDIDDPEKQKPHPHMLTTIMRSQNVKSDETIFIGDAKNDVLMARSAGVIPIVVLTGHLTAVEARNLGVEYVVEDVTHIESVLDKLNL